MQKKLFNRYYLCVWFGSLCLLLVHNMLNNALPLYLASIGFSTSFSGLIGVPFAILGIIGRLVGGYLADSRSRRLVMVSGTALIGVSAFLFGLVPAAALMLLLRGVQGMGFASGNAAFATASVDVTPPEKSNLGVGIFWAAMAVRYLVSHLGITAMLTTGWRRVVKQTLSPSGIYLTSSPWWASSRSLAQKVRAPARFSLPRA